MTAPSLYPAWWKPVLGILIPVACCALVGGAIVAACHGVGWVIEAWQ